MEKTDSGKNYGLNSRRIVLSLFALLVFSVLASTAFAVSVDRSMPDRVDPSSVFTVKFTINPEGTLSAFDLVDFVPQGWAPNDWSVSGYDKANISYETQDREYQGKTRTGLHWKFNAPLSSPVTLSYTMTAPAAAATYEFIGVWTYPGGFSSKPANLLVGAAPSPAPSPSPSPTPSPAPSPAPSPSPVQEDNTRWIIVALAIVVVVGAVYYMKKPKGGGKAKYSYNSGK